MPEFYKNIVLIRTIFNCIKTIEIVQALGINVCLGGIVEIGDSNANFAGESKYTSILCS